MHLTRHFLHSAVSALAAVAAFLSAPAGALANTFPPGRLYYASNSNGTVYDLTAGGSFAGATPVATGMGANLGQIAFSRDGTKLYGTIWSQGPVRVVTPGGVGATHVALTNVLGLCRTQADRLLVVRGGGGAGGSSPVMDITDPANVTTLATVPSFARNMTQLPTGEILVMGTQGRIFRVDTGTATVWATVPGAEEGGDIDYTSDGRVFASFWASGNVGVYEVTGGGTINRPRYVTPTAGHTFGIAIDRRTDAIYVAGLSVTFVLNVTGGGSFDFQTVGNNPAAKVFARDIPTTNDMALDFSPFAAVPTAPAVTRGEVTDICLNGATLAGTVNPGGAETTVHFEYRVSPMATWTSSSPARIAAGNSTVPVSVTVSEALQPSTGYEWRLVAVNSAGTRETLPGSFMTDANVPPMVEVAAGTRLSFKPAADVVVSLRASDPDAACGDSIVSYSWDLDCDGTADFTQASPVFELTAARRAEFGINEQGVKYAVCFSATDEYGGTGTGEAEIAVEIVDPQTSVLFQEGGAVPGAGEARSGIPTGATWVSFGVPAINGAGDLAFLGTMTWKEGTATKKKIYVGNLPFSATAESRVGVLAEVGGPVAGLSDVVWASFKAPLLAADGGVLVLGTVKAAVGKPAVLSAYKTVSVMYPSISDDEARLVAQTGVTAGPDGAVLKSIAAMAVVSGGHVALRGMLTVGSGLPQVTSADDAVAFTFSPDSNGALLPAVRMREGRSPGGGLPVLKSFNTLVAGSGTAGMGRGWLTSEAVTDSTGVTTTRVALTATATYADGKVSPPQAISHDLRTNVVARVIASGTDGTEIEGETGITVKGFGLPAFAGGGAIYRAMPTTGAAGLFALDPKTGAALSWARVGALAPDGEGAAWSSFGDPVLSADGTMNAVFASLKGLNVTSSNNTALFWDHGSAWRLLAREGKPAAEVDGAVWRSFSSLAVPGGVTGPILVAKLNAGSKGVPGPGGVTTRDDAGLWAVDGAGALRLLLREGVTEVGGAKVVSFSVLGAVSGSAGSSRSFNDAQQITVLAKFSDGVDRVLVITMPGNDGEKASES